MSTALTLRVRMPCPGLLMDGAPSTPTPNSLSPLHTFGTEFEILGVFPPRFPWGQVTIPPSPHKITRTSSLNLANVLTDISEERPQPTAPRMNPAALPSPVETSDHSPRIPDDVADSSISQMVTGEYNSSHPLEADNKKSAS
ncbi:hypothetical protein M231_05008 [Tremella mesenterica]|uniref:Uncharacterized protein n=1 Tax=Tremella mesenterica TaxID=5217 RepID=A0A4Q1BJ85_TREME|nr:uncharacterized protein TREMEDRAFT_62389 [Tremella mesenterica DSM 1558]EIW69531.1 hypothetical protein TREMEDRAFT_62389 [Tremella mesenterica DSM 1558]RXK37759.1 hypothetical protein M231_05008 [Tremella mesenterica]